MSCKLDFFAEALKEWKALDASVRKQFKKKLAEWLENPFVPASENEHRLICPKEATGWNFVSALFVF